MSIVEEQSNDPETLSPKGTTSGPDYAGLGLRIIANVIDKFVVVINMFLFIIFFDDLIIVSTIVLSTTASFTLFYILVLEGVWSGQTLGKKLMGIRVVRKNGSEIGVTHSVSRNFIGLIGWNSGIFGLLGAVLSIFISEKNQRIGDRFAGTIVVNE